MADVNSPAGSRDNLFSMDLFPEMARPQAARSAVSQTGPTAFQRGYVNYADASVSDPNVPSFLRSRDLMTLDPDIDGSRTEAWARQQGTAFGRDYVAGLTVFGRPMSRDLLMQSEAGVQLLDIAAKNRAGVQRGFMEAVTDWSWSDAPFVSLFASVGGSLTNAKMVSDAFKKLQNGEEVTDDELIMTRLFLAKQEREEKGSWGATVGDIVRQAPGFALEIGSTGGTFGLARGAVAKTVGVTTKVGTKLAVTSSVKKLGMELAEEALVERAKRKVGETASKAVVDAAVRKSIQGMGKWETGNFARLLSKSLRDQVVTDLTRTYGEKYVEKLGKNAINKIANNVAMSCTKRAAAKLGASNAYSQFAHGLGQAAVDWTVRGLLDHGHFGTPTSSVLFARTNSAGRALADAIGTLFVEAPIKGSLQFGANYLTATRTAHLLGYDLVSDAQMSMEASALHRGDRDMMRTAESVAMGMSLMEYVSENTGAGFTNLFRATGLATGLAKQAPRAFVGELGGILQTARATEAGGLLRSLIRKAVPSVDEMSKRNSEFRTRAVSKALEELGHKVDTVAAARVAGGDVSALPAAIRTAVGDVGNFVRGAVKKEIDVEQGLKTFRSYFTYVASDYMVRHQLGPDQLMNAFQRMGYDGIVEEMLEERYNDFAKGLFGLDSYNHKDFRSRAEQAFRNIWVGPGGELDFSQLAAEAVGFAVPMVSRALAVHAQRALGGSSEADQTRAVARAAVEGLRAMDVEEMRAGEYLDNVDETISKLQERKRQLKERQSALVDAAVAAHIIPEAEAAEVKAKTAKTGKSDPRIAEMSKEVDEEFSAVVRKGKAQWQARSRVLQANGIKDIASINREALMFVPVLDASVEQGDLADDKLRNDMSSKQIAQAAGSKLAAIENAWRIGRSSFLALGSESDWSAPWYRRWASKAVGVAAAFITGEPALAFRNYAGWAATDEGLDPRVAAYLLEDYKKLRAETIKVMSNEPGRRSHEIPEDAVWERMQDEYKKRASRTMASMFAIKNARLFSYTEMVDQAILHLAKTDGWDFDPDTREFTRGDDKMTYEQYHASREADVEALRKNIADATFRLMADNPRRRPSDTAMYTVAYLPPGAPEAERTAYALALKMAGFGASVAVRNYDGSMELEDVVASGTRKLLRRYTAKIVADSVGRDGRVDYKTPSEKDILEVASVLGYPVKTGSDEELRNLRETVVDVSRQIEGVIDQRKVMSFSREVRSAQAFRLFGRTAVTIDAVQGSDGYWYVSAEDITGESKDGLITIKAKSADEVRDELGKRGFREVERGVVITDVTTITADDPFLLAQQFGLTRKLLEMTLGQSTDQTKTHPALRKKADGDWAYNSIEHARRQVEAEDFKAGLYKLYGDDVSRYPGGTPEARQASYDEAKAAYVNMYGDHGYMKVLDDLLEAAGVTVPNRSASFSGTVLGLSDKYVVPLKSLHARRGSAVTYVAVNSLYGQDDSSALLNAVVEEAFSRWRVLIREGGRFRSVVTDFLKFLDLAAQRRIASFDATTAEAKALKALRDDITCHYVNPTRRSFVEVVSSYALFMCERDRALGKLSSAHSLAFQVLAQDVYKSPQFLRLFALADLMLGGDGFSMEAAARRFKANMGDVAPKGVERIVGLFHQEGAEYLKKFVNGFKPLGMSYGEFVEEVNRQAATLNLRPRETASSGVSASPGGLMKSLADAFFRSGFTDLESISAAFNVMARTPDRELARVFRSRRDDVSLIISNYQAGVESRKRELAEAKDALQKLESESAKAEVLSAVEKKARSEEIAGLRQTIDDLQDKLGDSARRIGELSEELARLKGAPAPSESRPKPQPENSKHDERQVNAAFDAGNTLQNETPVEGTPPSLPGSADDAFVYLNPDQYDPDLQLPPRMELAQDKLEVGSGAHIEVDTEGNLTVKGRDYAIQDLPDEACEYLATTVRNIFRVLDGYDAAYETPQDEARFYEVVRTLTGYGIRNDELYRLYGFYVKQVRQSAEARRETPDVDLTEIDEDDEGAHSDGNRNFGDKALAEYEGKQLGCFLTIANIAAPETGRDLQSFLDLLKTTVRKQLSEAPETGDLHDALQYLDSLLNPRERLTIDTSESLKLRDEIDQLTGQLVKVDPVTGALDASVVAEHAVDLLQAEDSLHEAQMSLAKLRLTADRGETVDKQELAKAEDAVREARKRYEEAKREPETAKSRNEELKRRIDELRLKRMEMVTSNDREAAWRRELNRLDHIRNGRSEFDRLVGALLKPTDAGRPVNRKAALLLGFLKSLDRPARVRMLTLCANSAACSRAVVSRRDTTSAVMDIQPMVGKYGVVNARLVSAAFGFLRGFSAPGEVDEVIERLRDDCMAVVPSAPEGETSAVEFRVALDQIARSIEGALGEENPLVQALRAPSFSTYIEEGFRLTYGTRPERVAGMIKNAATRRGDELPSLVQSIIDLLVNYRNQVDAGDGWQSDDVKSETLDRLADIWFAYNVAPAGGRRQGLTTGHRTAMVSTEWKQLLEVFRASLPVTVENSVFVPGRSTKTSSKVAMSSRGVIPVLSQWMDRPLSDHDGFAYIAKNFMPGVEGDRLRAMSDADFVENVLPRCRQTMTWPDALHTPLVAKNLARDYTPDAVWDACRTRFIDMMGDKYYNAHEGGIFRWYVPMFSGEHQSCMLLQLPRLGYVKDGGVGGDKLTTFFDGTPGDLTFEAASTRISVAMGMGKLGKDPKRASLSCAEIPGVAMRGMRTRDGVVEFGECRVHTLVSLAPEMSFANNEGLIGGIVAVGYAAEEQRKAAGDPKSNKLKLHYLSSSGEYLTMYKGLTSVARKGMDQDGGLYGEGETMRVLQDYLLKFRKSDADISTSIMMDRDALKVGILNSKVMGVPYVDDSGREQVEPLFDYIARKLRDAEVPSNGLSGAELDAMLADDTNDGKFAWSVLGEDGKFHQVRTSVSELLPEGAMQVNVVEGLSGPALDVSFVDNSLTSYTVANVSHSSRPSIGRLARNLMVDASTLAASFLRYFRSSMTPAQVESAKALMESIANWGLATATVSTDPATIEDARTGFGQSEAIRQLVEVENENPFAPVVENQLAYDVLKRVVQGLNIPVYKLDCALVPSGSVYDDSLKTVGHHSKDAFYRYCGHGSVVYGKEEALWRKTSRHHGLARINVRSDGFRIGWHLDRKAFAQAYGAELENADGRTLTEKIEEILGRIRRADRAHVDAFHAHMDYIGRTPPSQRQGLDFTTVAARLGQTYHDARDEARKLRAQFAECFVDHYGQRISRIQCRYEQLGNPRRSTTRYCDTVCFDDLFMAGQGAEREFDRSAVHFGDTALRLHEADAAKAHAAWMATDEDPVFLAGSLVGFPRTPSYNGSMWSQALRAAVYAEPELASDGTVVAGYDATVIPDAQSLKILGADHDGDKAACYMYMPETETGTAAMPSTGALPGPDAEDLRHFDTNQSDRDAYLRKLVVGGFVLPPVPRADVAGKSEGGYRFSRRARTYVSNQVVQGIFDLTRGMVRREETGDARRDFYGTSLARATKMRPVGSKAQWDALIAAAGDAANYLKDSWLADTQTGAHVMTSARAADKARGQIVALAGNLNVAQLSGKFDKLFDRDGATTWKSWFEFIYRLDGISNATFDDIKEQVCRRLGWTDSTITTVVADLMFSGERAPQTDGEFLDVLTKYVKSIADKGSRYYMLAAAEPPEGNDEFMEVHRDIRLMYFTQKEGEVPSDTDLVTQDKVMDFFGITRDYDSNGNVFYKFGGTPHADAVNLVNNLKSLVNWEGFNEARIAGALLENARRYGGDSAGAGYVYWLVKKSDGSVDAARDFLRWARGVKELDRVREFAASVNYAKADPGDGRKLGRREIFDKVFAEVMNSAPHGEPDRVLEVMHAATRTVYRASGLSTLTGRGALASNNRGAALSALVDHLTSGASSDATRKMLAQYAVVPTVPAYDLLTLEGNLQTRPYTIAALRTMEPARSGFDLFGGDVDTQWSVMEAIARAAVSVDSKRPGLGGYVGEPYMRSVELRRGLEAMVSVLYSLVSSSYAGTLHPAMAYLALHPDYSYGIYGESIIEGDEDPDPSGEPDPNARRKMPYLRKLSPAYRYRDASGRARACRYMQEALEGAFDSDGAYRARTALYQDVGHVARGFELSVQNLKALALEYDKDFDKKDDETGKTTKASKRANNELPTDIRIVLAVMRELAKASLPEDQRKDKKAVDKAADELVVQPSTILRQVIPLLAVSTSRVGTNQSVLDIMPGVRRRISDEIVRLYSGALEKTAEPLPPGFSLLDIDAATAGAPAGLDGSIAPVVTYAALLDKEDDEGVQGQERVLNALLMTKETTGNAALETRTVEKWSKVAAKQQSAKGKQPAKGKRPTAYQRKAPPGRVMVDVLGPDRIVKTLCQYAEESLAPEVHKPPVRTPDETNAGSRATPRKEPTEEAKRLAVVINSALGTWARATADGDVVKVESRLGIQGSGARRFAKNGVGMVLTVHVGKTATADPNAVDVNSPAVAASFCEAAKLLGITPAQFLEYLSYDERRALLNGLMQNAGSVGHALGIPSAVRLTGKDMAVLAGYISVSDSDPGTFFHELFHSMIGMFRMMDVFDPEDIKEFRRRFGDAPKDSGMLFNEEKAAEEFRRYALRKTNSELAEDVANDGERISVFDKILRLIRSFVNALCNGFSHSERGGEHHLFDMVLSGYAQMSEEKQRSLDEQASVAQTTLEFNRLLEAEQGALVALEAGGSDVSEAEKSAVDDVERRAERARAKHRRDPFKGAQKEGSTDARKVPNDSPAVARLAARLQAELAMPTIDVRAVGLILRSLVQSRKARAPIEVPETVPATTGKPKFIAVDDQLNWMLSSSVDDAGVQSPHGPAAAGLRPMESLGRAAARALIDKAEPADIRVLSAVSTRLTWSQLVQADARMKKWAEGTAVERMKRDVAVNRMKRREAVVRQGVSHFLSLADPPTTVKAQRAAAENQAYMALMAAAGWIAARTDPSNAARRFIGTANGKVRTRRAPLHISSSQYAGFLIACGSKDPWEYIGGLASRLDKAMKDEKDPRKQQVAEFLRDRLDPLLGLTAADMVTRPGDWQAVLDEFIPEVMSGIRRGDFDPETGDFGPYRSAVDEDTPEDGETPEKAARNRQIYQLGAPGADASDASVQALLRDVMDTVFAVAASARFSRELGVVHGSFTDSAFTARNPAPWSMLDVAEELSLAEGDIANLDSKIIDRHCEPSFVMANFDQWLAGSLPERVGNLALRELLLASSAAMRGFLTKQTMECNFWQDFLGLGRGSHRKLLRLVEHEGEFEMGNGFYHRVPESRRKKYLGFDNSHGMVGSTTGEEFTIDEYRMVDMFFKALAVRANGDRQYVTGLDGLYFTSSMLPAALDGLTPENVAEQMRRFESAETDESDPRAVSRVFMVLSRIPMQLHKEAWGSVEREDGGSNGLNVFDKFVSAMRDALEAAHAERKRRLDADNVLMTDAEFNDFVLGELEQRGVVVAARGDNGLRTQGAIAIDVGEIEKVFRGSTAYAKLRRAGRSEKMLRGDYIIKALMENYYAMRREVRNHPWLTAGDARFLNNFGTPLPFFQGTGMFMYHANRACRDAKVTARVRLGKHEDTFISICSARSNLYKDLADISQAQLEMLHDYYGTEENGQELLQALLAGEYSAGTRKSVDTGLELDPATAKWLDVAKAIYLKQQERFMQMAEGKSLDDLDDEGAIVRMARVYEEMTEAGGTTLVGGVGMTDSQMYRLHGALPANMQLGHKIQTAMKGIADSLYRRSVLVNMLFTKTIDGQPVYYMNPSVYGVEAGGIPDEVWGAAAKWWAQFHPGIVYNSANSGLENARAAFAVIASKIQQEHGELNNRKYESMKLSDLQGQKTVENVLCIADDPSDEQTSRLNTLGLAGEALGYAKHFFMADRAPGNAKLAALDHVMAWSKSMSVMCSAFFPIATKWESPVAAVGALATLGSNLSPKTARKLSGGLRKLQSLFSLGKGWIDEDFIGFGDILKMMDSNDPFLADLVMWAESMGITMSTTSHNPMEPTKGMVAHDIRYIQDKIRETTGSDKFAAKAGAVLETMFLRSGEKAFTYALNATKLAVTCQVAMKLRAEARRSGRAFDPIRDLGKYAAYIDTEVGGINPLRYAWAHPQMQSAMNRLMFSWQWTRSSWEAGGGHFFEDLLFGGHTINKETRQYIMGRWLRMYGTIMIGVPMLMQIFIKGIALAAGRDDPDDKWWTWENEDKTKWTAYDLTPLMKVVHDHELSARTIAGLLGGAYGFARNGVPGALFMGAAAAAGTPDYTGKDPANSTTRGRRYYGHFGKQGWEFFRWFDRPVEQMFSKLSMPTQRLLEGVTGRNLAYLDREIPLTDTSFVERWTLPYGPHSAWSNLGNAFMPFSVGSMLTFGDAGIMSYFGPVQMGASRTNIVDRMANVLEAWAMNDRKAYRYGQLTKKKTGRKLRYELVSDIAEEARINGIAHPDRLVTAAIGTLTPRLYGRLERLLSSLDPDAKADSPVSTGLDREIRRTCRALMRLGATYRTAMQSLKKRLKQRGADLSKMSDSLRIRTVKELSRGFRNPYGY